MKKTMRNIALLLILAIIGITPLSAQVSKNIIDTTKVWHDGLIFPGRISTFSFQFGEDTIYNNRTYKRLIASSYYYISFNILFREDSNRVYFVNLGTNNPEECLLYDFNLEVGDTLTILGLTQVSTWQDVFYEVKSTDTIIIDGTPLKHLVLTTEYGDMEWVEGIGNLSGLLHRDGSWVDGATHELLCFSQDGEVLYQSYTAKRYNECFIEATLDEIDNYDVSIFPNPANNYITVTSTARDCKLLLYDEFGRIVRNVTLNDTDIIDIENLTSDTYTAVILHESKIVKTEKIIKL